MTQWLLNQLIWVVTCVARLVKSDQIDQF